MPAATVKLSEISPARVYADDGAGDPLASGPRCATCGDLAAWGEHPLCERDRGDLLVWETRDPVRDRLVEIGERRRAAVAEVEATSRELQALIPAAQQARLAVAEIAHLSGVTRQTVYSLLRDE